MDKSSTHKFPYNWTLKDAVFTKDKGKVFSCFACGGGSTMGYKLAGFDVLGCNEIDPKMIEAYKTNHNPKYAYLEPIQTFKLRKDLPKELYELDILDGSPPCSSFSMAGNREKDWGKDKVFREGQAMQVLDTLFFDFIDLAKELQPKVVVAENVAGLLMGNAKSYVIEIYKEFDKAGYYVQHFLLDSSSMGVPQKRERVFFICLRKDLSNQFMEQKDMFTMLPKIDMVFSEEKIPGKQYFDYKGLPITDHAKQAWDGREKHHTKLSDSKKAVGMKETNFNCKYIFKDKPLSTLTANGYHSYIHFDKPVYISEKEMKCGGSYPQDYNFVSNQWYYLIGMSVPPVMTAQIASNIYDQWLSKL